MITWVTTVAPATVFSAVTSHSGIRRYQPGAGASVTNTFTAATTSYEAWSQTIAQVRYDEEGGVLDGQNVGNINQYRSTLSVLATKDSYSEGGFEVDNSGNTTRTNFFTYSIKSVLDTTTTQTTRSYTYTPTITATSTTVRYITQDIGGVKTTQSESVSATTITKANYTQSVSRTALTTTTFTGGTDIMTPMLATVVQAEESEIIWAIDTSAAKEISASLQAVENIAATRTKTTIMPWTQTVNAQPADDSETTATSFPESTTSFAFQNTQFTNVEILEVENFNVLPHSFIATQSAKRTTVASTLQSTVVTAIETGITKASEIVTAYTVVPKTAIGFYGGLSHTSSTLAPTTYTSFRQVDTCLTKTSTTEEEVVAVPATYLKDSDGNVTSIEYGDSYTWTATGAQSTIQALTTFAYQEQGLSTNSQQIALRRLYRQGAVDHNFNVGLGYDVPISMTIDGFTVPVGRGSFSAYPQTFAMADSDGNTTASGTVSKLSVTIQTPETTSSAVFQTNGSANLIEEDIASRSRIDAAYIGNNETIFRSIPRGVFFSNNSNVSTSGATSSYTKGQIQSPWVKTVSFVGPHVSPNTANPLTFSVTRNSHPEHAAITGPDAYQTP